MHHASDNKMPATHNQPTSTTLWLQFLPQLWLTHALAYLAHEYAHSLTAFTLGFKSNPLALNYGHLTLSNLLLLGEIDENVDYTPIFATGHGHLAALIAIAGVLFGNGLTYLLARRLLARAHTRHEPSLTLFAFLLCLMSVGNFLSYVPLRTFTTHADIATVEQGLGISPWPVALGLGIPFAIAILHTLARLLPQTRRVLFPAQPVSQALFVVLSAFVVFGFFGSAGLHRYGSASHVLSLVCLDCLLPATILLGWPRTRARPA